MISFGEISFSSTFFVLARKPETSFTLPKILERFFVNSRLAFPSIGGCVHVTTSWSSVTSMVKVLARGFTLNFQQQSFSCLLDLQSAYRDVSESVVDDTHSRLINPF